MIRPKYMFFAGALLAACSSTVFAGDSSIVFDALQNPGMAVVSEDDLAKQSGRQGIDLMQLNDSDQTAALDGNQIQQADITGGNFIDNGSFAGSVGIVTAIQNSGNNVIIQESTLVNVIFQQ